jgi:hypothetical protein
MGNIKLPFIDSDVLYRDLTVNHKRENNHNLCKLLSNINYDKFDNGYVLLFDIKYHDSINQRSQLKLIVKSRVPRIKTTTLQMHFLFLYKILFFCSCGIKRLPRDIWSFDVEILLHDC